MLKIIDPYIKLKRRIQTYIKRFPLPDKVENDNNFRELRLIETLIPSHPELKNKYNILREKVIVSNGGFGMKYAIKYCRLINDTSVIEDIFQQSQIGILESVDRFDPDLVSKKTGETVNFTTFAWHYVRKCIIDFIKRNKLVTAPREMARNIKNVSDIYDILYSEAHGKEVTLQAIQEKLFNLKEIKLKISMIKDILQLIHLNSTESPLNFIVGITDDIEDEDVPNESNMLLKAILLKHLNGMDLNTLEIVKMRFGIDYERPHTIPEIKLLKQLSDEDIENYKEKTREFLNLVS